MTITLEYIVKKLAQSKQKKRFEHKTRYGRVLEERHGYDRQAHEKYYHSLKDTPYNPLTWDK